MRALRVDPPRVVLSGADARQSLLVTGVAPNGRRLDLTGKALIAAYNAKTDLGKALESVLGWDQFATTVEEAERLVEPFDCDFLDEMRNQYPQIRQYSPALLNTFELRRRAPLC